jgi:hypothetical protein
MSDVVFWLIMLCFIVILIGITLLYRMIHSVFQHSRLVSDSVEAIFTYLEQLNERVCALESKDADNAGEKQ